MNAQTLLEAQWPYLLSLLPAGIDLEASAREAGALTRKRGVDSAENLLRIVLGYALCGMPLRHTAAWAEVSGIGSMSNVALHRRLKKCSEWMGCLLGHKLAERAAPPPSLDDSGLRARLVDATSICHPGATGATWRVHLGYDLKRHCIDHIELTDFHGGETLKRFTLRPGEVVVGDRGYSHRPGMHGVSSDGAIFVVRHNWSAVPLIDDFDLFAWLRGLPDATASEAFTELAPDAKRRLPALPVRVVAIRKSEAAAEEARRKIMRECSRKKRIPDPRSLEAAGYVCVATNDMTQSMSAAEVLGLYRFRWQVELAFKRLKGLLHLGELPSKDPPVARTYIYAKLLGALMLDDLTERFLDFSPWGYRLG